MNKKHRVYLVDDDTKFLLVLKDHLDKHSQYDLDVHLFTTGENALEEMDDPPELVVLDYYLDGVRTDAANGLDVLKEMKRTHPEVDVLMMSSQDDLKTGLDTLEWGASDYIIKGETSNLRAQLIIDHILERKAQKEFRREQEKQMRWLIAGIVLMAAAIVCLAIFAV